MPTYQLVELFTRIGLALVAGALIFMVPITYRRGRWALTQTKRIIYLTLSVLFLLGFIFYIRFIWTRFVPHDPDPDPITYPVPPTTP